MIPTYKEVVSDVLKDYYTQNFSEADIMSVVMRRGKGQYNPRLVIEEIERLVEEANNIK